MKEFDYDAGVYLLELLLKEGRSLWIGKLGEWEFAPGYYYYAGTAQRNLQNRVKRHLRKEKTLRWHIDYLLEVAEVIQVYTWPGAREMECMLGEKMRTFPAARIPVPGFGASDCNCLGHLLYFNYRPNMANLLHTVRSETKLIGMTVLE